MKNIKLLTLFIFVAFNIHAQTFYIDAVDKYSYNQIEKKLTELGFKTVDSTNADYMLKLMVWVTSKLNSMYKGNLTAFDKTGKEITKSKDIRRGAVAVNGYNASYNIAKVIAEKELPTMLLKLKTNQ